MKKSSASQKKLKKEVLERNLCTGCGACVNLCPYQVIYSGRTVQLHECDLTEGKCYKFCPRTPADHVRLREMLFNVNELTPEIGAVKNYYWSRAADPDLRKKAQHGGTVTALLELALDENVIDYGVVSTRNERLFPEGVGINNKKELRNYTGSRFMVSPTVATVNQMISRIRGKVGVVATPCQALALAKMKLASVGDDQTAGRINLVIGLFCGWTLSVEKFNALLRQNELSPESITGMDIPAGKKVLELSTDDGKRTVPISNIEECIRQSCRYCIDSTAEYADISAGAARFAADPESAQGWNQLIVRTEKGRAIIELAVKCGALEIREAPAGCLQELKNAAVQKKKTALRNIIAATGTDKNLLYLNIYDPVVKKYSPKTRRNKKNG
jgi:coenzyme F420 hydrogenase subunit beta